MLTVILESFVKNFLIGSAPGNGKVAIWLFH